MPVWVDHLPNLGRGVVGGEERNEITSERGSRDDLIPIGSRLEDGENVG